MNFDLLDRRREKFTLWIPGRASTAPIPGLVIGTFNPKEGGVTGTLDVVFEGPLVAADKPDLWELDPKAIPGLHDDGTIYHYWFEVSDYFSPSKQICVTDPFAYTVDYRPVHSRDEYVQPPAVVKYLHGKLVQCDLDGSEAPAPTVPKQEDIPDNNQIVIYELPASWVRPKREAAGLDVGKFAKASALVDGAIGGMQVDVGTFTDVLALLDKDTAGERFKNVPEIANGAILTELGANALELLPAADARPRGEWGYATANYCAPDFDLGSSSDLVRLVDKLHAQNTRLFADTVMAFGHDPYVHIAFDQFHINPKDEQSNPDSWQSHSNQIRDGWGGSSWRYLKQTQTYDPQSGQVGSVHPSWSFHRAHLHRWMRDFGVGGYRLDSVNNVGNYDFLRTFKDDAWAHYHARYPGQVPSLAKFLVIGEELSVPLDMLTSGALNALWNEPFQGRLRSAILGQGKDDNFEWTVRKMIDSRQDSSHPFSDGAQAVNYITSHDVEGDRKERLYNFLLNNGISSTEAIVQRAKLAFTCLLTAVGIPMIFAGEEFCDQHDLPIAEKQIDPVNYARRSEPWRSRIFDSVARLVRLRKTAPALAVNDTDFIHMDFSNGRRILAWKRGAQGQAPVVVVANFSDQATPGEEYIVHGWPERERGDWKEVTEGDGVEQSGKAGTGKIGAWEAKVYTY